MFFVSSCSFFHFPLPYISFQGEEGDSPNSVTKFACSFCILLSHWGETGFFPDLCPSNDLKAMKTPASILPVHAEVYNKQAGWVNKDLRTRYEPCGKPMGNLTPKQGSQLAPC